MNVAIMTWSKQKGYLNYGTALQVCALSYYVSQLGHSCQVIDYEPRKYEKYNANLIKNVLNKLSAYFHKTNIADPKRSLLFENFFDKNIFFTKQCNTMSELEDLNESFDCFISGSDQIWALYDPHYFLDFVKDNNKKIAYAPSIGMTHINNNIQKRYIRELTSNYCRISTREKIGSTLISSLIGKNVDTVLDPTLLLTSQNWSQICNVSKTVEQDYILVYFLGHNKKHWKIANKISNILKKPILIIPVYASDYNRKGCIKEAVGPNEFVSLIANSALVLTDSFHGVSFSINFKKDFYAFKRFKGDNSFQNNRIFEILSNVGLMNRLIEKSPDNIHQIIDFARVESKLQDLRKHSMVFLEESIKYVQNKKKTLQRRDIKSVHCNCCGCGVCAEACPRDAIKMEMTKEGFWESTINYDLCINCGQCLKMCPLHNSHGVKYEESAKYSFKNYDLGILKQSSSGGAGFSLGKILLQKGFSVVGCTYNTEKKCAEHILLENDEELPAIQGSKYIQSNFWEVLKTLKTKEHVAFFGTPCQIAGARKLFGEKGFYIDLICHGVPSHNLFKKYLLYVEKEYGLDIKNLNVTFRDKSCGWRKRFIRLSDGKRILSINQHKDLFYLMFEHSICYGNQCYECPWRDKSEADIRIGDYWGDEFIKDKTGVSIVFAFSDRGRTAIDSLKSFGILNEKNDVNYKSFQQTKNIIKPIERDLVIDLLSDDSTELSFIVKKYINKKERQMKIRRLVSKFAKKYRVIRYGKGKI